MAAGGMGEGMAGATVEVLVVVMTVAVMAVRTVAVMAARAAGQDVRGIYPSKDKRQACAGRKYPCRQGVRKPSGPHAG